MLFRYFLGLFLLGKTDLVINFAFISVISCVIKSSPTSPVRIDVAKALGLKEID